MSDFSITVSEPTRIVTLILTPVQAADILTDLDKANQSGAVGASTVTLINALTTVTTGKSYQQ